MGLARTIIVITALTFVGFGGFMFVDPGALAFAGFAFPHWSATVEVVAQYGACQVMLGLFRLIGLVWPSYLRPTLLLWAMIFTGFVIGRVYGLLAWGGASAWSLSAGQCLPGCYNAGAIYVVELPLAVLFWTALVRTQDAPEPVAGARA